MCIVQPILTLYRRRRGRRRRRRKNAEEEEERKMRKGRDRGERRGGGSRVKLVKSFAWLVGGVDSTHPLRSVRGARSVEGCLVSNFGLHCTPTFFNFLTIVNQCPHQCLVR